MKQRTKFLFISLLFILVIPGVVAAQYVLNINGSNVGGVLDQASALGALQQIAATNSDPASTHYGAFTTTSSVVNGYVVFDVTCTNSNPPPPAAETTVAPSSNTTTNTGSAPVATVPTNTTVGDPTYGTQAYFAANPNAIRPGCGASDTACNAAYDASLGTSATAVTSCSSVPGVCGAANGRILVHEPDDSTLCSSGRFERRPGVTLNTSTSNWEWTCSGICGGTSMKCSARAAKVKFRDF